jgi:hypothetical protein
MNRPNSGWNTGTGRDLNLLSVNVVSEASIFSLGPLELRVLLVSRATTLLGQFCIGSQSFKDFGLPQRKLYFAFLFCVGDYQVFNLLVKSASSPLAYGKMTYLITPEHGVTLLALGFVPYFKELLPMVRGPDLYRLIRDAGTFEP